MSVTVGGEEKNRAGSRDHSRQDDCGRSQSGLRPFVVRDGVQILRRQARFEYALRANLVEIREQ